MTYQELIYLLRFARQCGLSLGEVFRLIGDPNKITLREALALLKRAARQQQQQRGLSL